MLIKYRIFQVGYNGTFYCPFSLGNVQDEKGKDIDDYILFDNPELAAEYARLYFIRKNHNYVVFPTFIV